MIHAKFSLTYETRQTNVTGVVLGSFATQVAYDDFFALLVACGDVTAAIISMPTPDEPQPDKDSEEFFHAVQAPALSASDMADIKKLALGGPKKKQGKRGRSSARIRRTAR